MLLIRLLLACLLISLLSPLSTADASSRASAQAPDRQALLLLINKLSYDDLALMPEVQKLSARGAVALMNVNTGGKRTDANAYVTMAAGVPARLDAKDVLVYNADEQVHDVPVTAIHTGLHDQKVDDEVLLLSLPRILRSQERWNYSASAVSLGDALHSRGMKTAVLGASDKGGELWRPAALFTSDGDGRTPYGEVGGALFKRDPARPYGVRTDYEKLWSEYVRLKQRAALLVFDLADLYRVAEYSSLLDSKRLTDLRREVLAEIDRFVGKLAAEIGPNRQLLIASPQVSAAAAAKREWLSPVVVAGGPVQAGSVLTSATTRREGIVSNLDIAPTLLQFLRIERPAGMIGYPLQGVTGLKQEQLAALKEASVRTYNHRSMVLGALGALVGLGLVFGALRLFLGVRVHFRLIWIRALLWAGLALPLCLFLLPLLHPTSLWEVAGGLVVLCLLLVAIPFRILPFCQTLSGRMVWLSAWTVCAVVIDAWQGGMLAKRGLLSYDPIVGARYYGVGNEYMGVVIGAAVLLYAALLRTSRIKRGWLEAGALIGGLFLTAFFASPALGTNTGGALTAAATTGLCYALQKRLRPLPTAGVLLASLLGAGGLLLLFNLPSAPPSHIGAAAGQVLTGGALEMVHILARKSDMFVRLLFSSVWPPLFLLVLSLFAYALFTPSLLPKRVWHERDRPYRTAVGGMLCGAMIGLFTNDSGIVVLAMMSLFALFPTLLIWLEAERGRGETPKRSISLRHLR